MTFVRSAILVKYLIYSWCYSVLSLLTYNGREHLLKDVPPYCVFWKWNTLTVAPFSRTLCSTMSGCAEFSSNIRAGSFCTLCCGSMANIHCVSANGVTGSILVHGGHILMWFKSKNNFCTQICFRGKWSLGSKIEHRSLHLALGDSSPQCDSNSLNSSGWCGFIFVDPNLLHARNVLHMNSKCRSLFAVATTERLHVVASHFYLHFTLLLHLVTLTRLSIHWQDYQGTRLISVSLLLYASRDGYLKKWVLQVL